MELINSSLRGKRFVLVILVFFFLSKALFPGGVGLEDRRGLIDEVEMAGVISGGEFPHVESGPGVDDGVIVGSSGELVQCDSENVRRVGSWPFGPAKALVYDEGRGLLYLGSGSGVYILDVSDPGNIERISEGIRAGGCVEGLFYESGEHRLYVACGVWGLEVWDVSEEVGPVRLGRCDVSGTAYGVYVLGGYAYVAAGVGGLRVIDVYDPVDPHEVGYYDTPGTAYGV